MFDLLKSIIDYASSSNYGNYDGYIVYGCITMILIFCTVTIDFMYKIFLRFFPSDLR